ncbi:PKHD-type hydroxylase [Stieleria maiorica]|uniref:PKHD-type hydroxylase n=1 Tax=Stieleria maiorica TaxID=2795974 RepID=A0A5B9MFY5_9BACT|nr:Fe2+-dependent dioxygenase [Stieleria maiorica]QEF98930.1 PKHD-type hydroxylase [Stieleria maiorica]
MLINVRNVLNSEQLSQMQRWLGEAEFQDGKLTAGKAAREVKQNLQASGGWQYAREAEKLIVSALQTSQPFLLSARPKVIAAPMFACYREGMSYGRHLDNPLMGRSHPLRTDVSVTVFLNDPDQYEGGQLVIESDAGPLSVKGNAGDAVVYPATTLHRVEPVTAGERLVAVTWVQSMVRSAEQRRILFDLSVLTSQLAESRHQSKELAEKCQFNLFRMWADV